jgi:PPP family 3-phenylpropionic acid transporter
MANIPYYWRLSGFYFFYFGSIGALMPYWSLYLHHVGFDAKAIGELIAIIMATKIIAPNIWGWLADRTGYHITLVRISSLLAVIGFAGVLLGQNYLWLVLVMITFSFFWNAALPQFEATTLAYLGGQAHRYSQIRLWGSIGFIITVSLLGWLFKYISISLLPIILLGLFSGIWLSSLWVPEKVNCAAPTNTESFYQVLQRPTIIALFAVCFLMQTSHGPYYTFYSLYLENHGYARDIIGQLWALGVIAEVGLFLIMHRLLIRFSLSRLLILSLSLTVLRWLLIGSAANSLLILTMAQLLHATSYGMYHSVTMQLIRHYFADHQQGQAQALYGSLSFGAGGAMGSLISGYAWQMGAQFSYWGAAGICIIAIWISWRWLEPNKVA